MSNEAPSKDQHCGTCGQLKFHCKCCGADKPAARTSKQRLLDIQRRLEERGVTDIKFFWGNTSEKPLSQIASDVADVLDAYLSGETKPLPLFGDSVRRTETPRTYFHECKHFVGYTPEPNYQCPKCSDVETATGHCIDCIELKNALAAAVKVANEARECHDRDQDMRTMKLLIALSGHLPKWRADTDRIHDVLRRAVERLSAPMPPEEPTPERRAPSTWTCEHCARVNDTDTTFNRCPFCGEFRKGYAEKASGEPDLSGPDHPRQQATMSVDTAPGSRVQYMDCNGYPGDTDHCRRAGLIKDEAYEVVEIDVYSDYSAVRLKGFDGWRFNSVCFCAAENGSDKP